MGIYLVYLHIVCAFLSLGLLIVRGIIVKILLLAGYIVFSAKFFSKKQSQIRPHFFFFALAALTATMLLGYFH